MAKISYGQLAKLFHRLGTGYAAGLDMRTMFGKETERGNTGYKIQAKRVLKHISDGDTLANAMRSTGKYYPELAISVVEAGELGGRLDEAFKRLSKHYRTLVDFRNRFLNSIAWPCFELVAAVGVIALMILALGWVAQMMNSKPIDIFGFGFGTMGNLTLFLGVVFAFFGSGFILVYGTMKGWFGTLPMRIATRIPLVGKTIEALSLSRFAWTMSVAERAGMNPVQVSRLALQSTENFYYLRLRDEIADSLQEGKGYYDTFFPTDTFPSEFLDYVDTGEMTGELAETMDRVSENLRERAELNLNLIGKIGFFLVFALVAVMIGAVIIMLYTQYLNTITNIMNT